METSQPSRLERMPAYTAPAILLGVPALLWFLVQLRPETFYDNFVWKYLWGPIKADAAGRTLLHGGVAAEPGYNVVNTAAWAVLLGVCILGLAQLLQYYRQPMDKRLILGATAWVVAGSIWHVIEDTDLMGEPLQFFFITPIIYLLFAAFGIFTYIFGQWLAGIERQAGQEQALRQVWLLFMLIVLGYTALWWRGWGQIVVFANPIFVAAAAALTHVAIRREARAVGRIDPARLVMTMSLGWLLVGIVYLALFVADPWASPNDNAMPMALILAPLLGLAAWSVARWTPTKPLTVVALLPLAVFGVVLAAVILEGILGRLGMAFTLDMHAGTTVAVLFALGIVAWLLGARRILATWSEDGPRFAQALRNPVNGLIIFSQTLDGFATSLGVDFRGYVEKHVLSDAVIQSGATMWNAVGLTYLAAHPTLFTFVPLKFALALFVIYVIDVASREDAEKYPALMGIVKFAIIMVGIGPGVRDFVRLALGV